MDRYIRLFELKNNLYQKGAPVIIEAGILSKDSLKESVFAQVKIKSISKTPIKVVKVTVTPYDTAGEELPESIKYEYLDLDISRNEIFGVKNPIMMKNHTTRSFSVHVDEVVFADTSVWKSDGTDFTPLEISEDLIDVFANDSELLKEYHLKYGNSCKYKVLKDRDLWVCACGNINLEDEPECFICKSNFEELYNADIEVLVASKDERLENERIAREKANAIILEKKRKTKKIIAIVAPIAIVVIIAIIIISSYTEKLNMYNTAVDCISGENVSLSDYELASATFEQLGGFKDSSEKLSETRYEMATEHLSLKNYNNAVELFEKLGDYKDSKEKAEQIKLRNEVVEILKTSSGKYGPRGDESSSYYGFNKAAKLIKNFKGKKSAELKKLYKDINLALKYYGKWKIESGKLDAVGLKNSIYKNSVRKIAFCLMYDKSKGVYIKSLPVQKGTENKNGGFSYYSYYTEDFVVSSEKNYKFECKALNYSSDNVSYIPAIKNNSFKIKYFEDGVYTTNIVLSR